MSQSQLPAMNLQQLRGPTPAFRYSLQRNLERINPIVDEALRKFLTTTDYAKVFTYRRSTVTPEALIEDFKRSDMPQFKLTRDTIYSNALKELTDIMKPPTPIRPVHFTDLRQYPWNLSTSAEAPFVRDPHWAQQVEKAFNAKLLPSRKLNFHNLYNLIFDYNRTVVHLIKEGRREPGQFLYHRTAHARSHLVTDDKPDKIRMVYGVPKLHIMIEVMLLWDYVRQLRQTHNPYILWGFEVLNGGMLKLNELLCSPKFSTLLFYDFKRFDKSLLFEMIDDIHQIWRSYSATDTFYVPTREYPHADYRFKFRIDNLWEFMREFVKYGPTLMPDGSLWRAMFNSLPSGLFQTQLLDCFCNLLIIITTLMEMDLYSRDILLKVLGDDSIIGLLQHIPTNLHTDFHQRFSQIIWDRFRLQVAPLSETASMSVHPHSVQCLGYRNRYGFPYRDEFELLAMLAFRERAHPASQLRGVAIGIAYASAGCSQTVYNICHEVFTSAGYIDTAIDFTGFAKPLVMQDIYGLDLSDVTEFPSFTAISQNLYSYPVSCTNRIWNPDWFINSDLPGSSTINK